MSIRLLAFRRLFPSNKKPPTKTARSTVGTITEIYDFFGLLYARVGEAYSYNTGKKMVKFSEEEIVTNIFSKFKNKKIKLLAPLVRGGRVTTGNCLKISGRKAF